MLEQPCLMLVTAFHELRVGHLALGEPLHQLVHLAELLHQAVNGLDVVPDPLAIRLRREPLISPGWARSYGSSRG